MYELCVCAWCLWRPEEVPDPLELDLRMVVSCLVGVVINPDLCRSRKCASIPANQSLSLKLQLNVIWFTTFGYFFKKNYLFTESHVPQLTSNLL